MQSLSVEKRGAVGSDQAFDRQLSVASISFVLLATTAVGWYDTAPLAPGIVVVAAFIFIVTGIPGVIRRRHTGTTVERPVLPKFWTTALTLLAMLSLLPAFVHMERYVMLRSAGHSFAIVQAILFFQKRDARIVRRQFQIATIQLMLAAMLAESSEAALMLIMLTPMLQMLLALVALQQQREHVTLLAGFTRSAVAKTSQKSGESVKPTQAVPSVNKTTNAPSVRWSTALPTIPQLFPWEMRLIRMFFPTLLVTAIFFTLFPRFGEDQWQGMPRNGSGFTGFSDSIRLGELTPMLRNSEEASRVRLLDPSKQDDQGRLAVIRRSGEDSLYLRGSTVNFYEEGRWALAPASDPASTTLRSMAQLDDRRKTLYLAGGAEGEYFFPMVDGGRTLLQAEPLVRQELTLLSRRNSEAFCIWPALWSRVSDRNRLFYDRREEKLYQVDHRMFDENGMASEVTIPAQRTITTATLGFRGSAQLRTTPNLEIRYTPEMAASLLTRIAKPERLESLKRLSDEWMVGIPDDNRERPDLIAAAFEAKFHNDERFTYQIGGVPRDPTLDPIEDFVTLHPQGHCEYFATAMAIMLRFQGVPTRVVLGFCTPEYMETSGTWRAREHHAHAWVEVYLAPNQIPDAMKLFHPNVWRFGGWIRFDPTPTSDTFTFWNSPIAQAFDSFDYFWRQYVVGMNESRQQTIYAEVGNRIRPLTNWFRTLGGEWFDALRQFLNERGPLMRWIMMLGGIAILWGGFVLLRWTGRGMWMTMTAPNRHRAAERSTQITHGGNGAANTASEFTAPPESLCTARRLLEHWEAIAARHELVRQPHETPQEFVVRCADSLQNVYGDRWSDTEARRFIEGFYALRFGYRDPDGEECAQMRTFLETLEQST